MTDSTDSTEPAVGAPERRPGGRTARVRAQVLDAVRAELAEAGHEGLTVEGVAARAGVHRTTVYRRWRDVGGLLVDVIAAAGEMDWQPPDTGSLRGDLTALNREIQESLVVRPSFAVALMAASFHSEQAARARRDCGRTGTPSARSSWSAPSRGANSPYEARETHEAREAQRSWTPAAC